MNTLNDRAKLFIQLQLKNERPDWRSISRVSEIILKYNTGLDEAREKRVQEILGNDRKNAEFDLATANAGQDRR